MAPAARITYAERDRAFGRPCDARRLVYATLWGHRVAVHHLVHDRLVNACIDAHRRLAAAGLGHRYPRRVDSYACRRISGSGSMSLHAYGLAWDMFNTGPGVPPPGGVWTPDDPVEPLLVAALEDAGFTWGGRWRRRDTPHFEWAGRP